MEIVLDGWAAASIGQKQPAAGAASRRSIDREAHTPLFATRAVRPIDLRPLTRFIHTSIEPLFTGKRQGAFSLLSRLCAFLP